MNRKTVLIMVAILVGLCGLGAVLTAGAAGIYFFARGNNVPQATVSDIDGMALLYVPAGEFQMGSTEAQFQADVAQCVSEGGTRESCQKSAGDEKPAHVVYVDAFRIDRTDVTNAMYAK